MPRDIDRNEVARLVEQGAVLLEVLPEKEYAEEHLRDARSLPLEKLNRQTAGHLDRALPVIVYCNDQQ